MTTVVNKRSAEYMAVEDKVYIGRGSIWGNRYVIGKDGDRNEVIGMYKEWFLDKIENDAEFRKETWKLKGKALVCYCAPLLCHGNIIAEWLDWNSVESIKELV